MCAAFLSVPAAAPMSMFLDARAAKGLLRDVMVNFEAAKYNTVAALQNGAAGSIVKPVRDKVFVEKILEILF